MFKAVLYANILFWLITNFACYLAWYERTPIGLLRCYLLAVPFFFGALAKTLIVAYIIKYLLRSYEVRV